MLSNHLFSIKLPDCFVFDGACPRHNCLQPGCPHEYFHLSHNEGNVNISVCLCLNVNFLLCLVHLLQVTLSLKYSWWPIFPANIPIPQTAGPPEPGAKNWVFFSLKYQMCISTKWSGQWDVVVAFVTKRSDVSWAHLPSSWPRPWKRKSEAVCGDTLWLLRQCLRHFHLDKLFLQNKRKKKILFYGCIDIKVQAWFIIIYKLLLCSFFFPPKFKRNKNIFVGPYDYLGPSALCLLVWWRNHPLAAHLWRTSGLTGKARVWKLGRIKFTHQLLSYLVTLGWLLNLCKLPLSPKTGEDSPDFKRLNR